MLKRCLSLLLVLALLVPVIALADSYRNTLTPVSATLNQRMSTRSGPGTEYSEEIGTMDKSTSIVAYVLEEDNIWVMVEFQTQRGKVRCYTGKKRVDTAANLPSLQARNLPAYVNRDITPYYGPGTSYAPFYKSISAGTPVTVVYDEQGYALIDYWVGNLRFRSWVPLNALYGYTSNDVCVSQPTVQVPASFVESFLGTWVSDDALAWKLTLLADNTFFLTGKRNQGNLLVYGTFTTAEEDLILCTPTLDPYGAFGNTTLIFEVSFSVINYLNGGMVFLPLGDDDPFQDQNG